MCTSCSRCGHYFQSNRVWHGVSTDEIRALTDLAHSAGYLVHCDARFANAVASLGVAQRPGG